MKKTGLICKICNKEFFVVPSQIKRRKTCSKHCQGIYLNKLKDARVLLKCSNCGEEFWTYKYRLKHKKHFCSEYCRAHFTKGKNHPKWKNISKKRKCQNCGKIFTLKETKRLLEKDWGKYCSKKCTTEAKKGTGKYQRISEEKARKLFEKYKISKYPLILFAKSKGHSEQGLSKLFKEYFPDEYETVKEEKLMAKNMWYKKGRRFEYRIRNYFKARNFYVLRSPASQGPADLVAIKKGLILLIQCKSSSSVMGSLKEKEELSKLSESIGALPILAYRKSPQKIAFREISEGKYKDYEI